MIRMTHFLSTFTLLLSFLANAQEPGSLKLVVRGMTHSNGTIKAALYKSPDQWLETHFRAADTTIYHPDEVVLFFKQVPAGEYAISIFHDENGNGALDTGTFGIPTEDYAFSNNAKGMFGPASYEDSSFRIASNEITHIINLN